MVIILGLVVISLINNLCCIVFFSSYSFNELFFNFEVVSWSAFTVFCMKFIMDSVSICRFCPLPFVAISFKTNSNAIPAGKCTCGLLILVIRNLLFVLRTFHDVRIQHRRKRWEGNVRQDPSMERQNRRGGSYFFSNLRRCPSRGFGS